MLVKGAGGPGTGGFGKVPAGALGRRGPRAGWGSQNQLRPAAWPGEQTGPSSRGAQPQARDCSVEEMYSEKSTSYYTFL